MKLTELSDAQLLDSLKSLVGQGRALLGRRAPCRTPARLRTVLGLDRSTAVVGAVGATLYLASGLDPGDIAR